jgi:hypothetical protein
MDVFAFRDRLVADYERFTRSFTQIQAKDMKEYVEQEYRGGRFWPAPLIQLNPSFVAGGDIDSFVAEGLLHPECKNIFRVGKTENGSLGTGLTLHKHQEEAIRIARTGESYVLTTGTGSGKSLSYFIPIVDHVLRRKALGDSAKGITAIVVYPMNALCNSQREELERFLCLGYPKDGEPVRFARYTGQESQAERQAIAANPPDILLTNYVMLELIMTRQDQTDLAVVEHAKGLRFLVLDELHTYRGRQGADVALLVRRVRERFNADLLCVGTSATMASEGTAADRSKVVALIASRLFGSEVKAQNVVTETLERVTPEARIDPASLAKAISAGLPDEARYDVVLDYVARQKVGGTHLTYGYLKQFPILAPEKYSQDDLTWITRRVLELSYTADEMKALAEDLRYDGPPFGWKSDRRALLRSELDAYYAHLYGLTRDALRYILDPTDVYGRNFPSETFRVLKNSETKAFGYYRTQKLVLDAWDRFERDGTFQKRMVA